MSEASDYFLSEMRKYLRCAVCKTRVQRVDRDYDVMRCEVSYAVHCHGKVEVVTVPSELVEDMTNIDFAEAFSSRALARYPAAIGEIKCPATN